MKLRIIVIGILLLSGQLALAQENPRLLAKKSSSEILIDGVPNEAIWKESIGAKDFYQYFPSDTSYSEGKTEVFVAYDDKNIYILAKCYDDLEGKYQTSSLRRDYRGGANDGISFIIDTYQDNTNAFVFGINPFGVLREGLISGGGEQRDSYSLSWDNKWTGEAKIYDNMWVAEIAIPLKTLRFKDNSKSWNMNFYRIDTKYNERSTWVHIPRNNQIFNLAFMGEIEFEEPLKKPGGNIAVIPYVSLNGFQNKLAEPTKGEKEQGGGYGFGGDIKLAVSPALNLDMTINPDFSQVEVDRQITNLTRFELFFPERRQFFLENADLFANFGGRSTRPFFSRRIGIARDSTTGQAVSQPILFGARLSGKVSKNLRVGVMSMQTAEVAGAEASLNYSVAVLQQKVFARSNISAIIVNKEDLNLNQRSDSAFQYNRVLGLEYNLASANNVWTGKAYYHYSMDPNNPDNAFSYGSRLSYNKRSFGISMSHQIVGDNFNAEVGFVPRRGFQRIRPRVDVRFYPTSKHVNRFGFSFEPEFLWDSNNTVTDYKLSLGYNVSFQNQSFIFANLNEEFTLLKRDFDPTRTGGEPLPAGTSYTYRYISGFYRSDQRKLFFVGARGSAGQFYNGQRYNIGGNINYRFQPYGNVGIDVQYNGVRLPSPYSSADLILVGPRVDITFSKTLYLTGIFQYNNQIDNINTNIRFQWRFKPVSDIYLVYSDNYYASDFTTKNRSLVFKLTYWLSI
jgi:uncharacterized protein DUF5916/cellulose/xylan binding protein with CBM9 domain